MTCPEDFCYLFCMTPDPWSSQSGPQACPITRQTFPLASVQLPLLKHTHRHTRIHIHASQFSGKCKFETLSLIIKLTCSNEHSLCGSAQPRVCQICLLFVTFFYLSSTEECIQLKFTGIISSVICFYLRRWQNICFFFRFQGIRDKGLSAEDSVAVTVHIDYT